MTEDDFVDEANREIKVQITAGSGYAIGTQRQVTVTVKDNDLTLAAPSLPTYTAGITGHLPRGCCREASGGTATI